MKNEKLSGFTESKFLGKSTFYKNLPPANESTKSKFLDDKDYPKSIDEFLEKKKKEIPLYDPRTGEPNPNYEKLTGKQNPLLQPPVNKETAMIYNKYNNKNPYDNIENKTLFSKMPFPYEPKFNNRFIVKFNNEILLPSWVFKNITRPSIKLIEKKIFGITYKREYKWNDIEFEIYDPIGPSSAQTIHFELLNLDKPFKTFNFELYLLDPTGVNIEKWDIIGCAIKSIDYGNLDYKNNAITTIKVKITPKDIKLRY